MMGPWRFGWPRGLDSWGVTVFMFAWGFGSFCFYKIASALVLDGPPNVLSCLVLAVITTGVMFMLTKALVVRYGKWCGDRVFKGLGQDVLVLELSAVTLFAGAVAALAGWLVVIGFDVSFAEELVSYAGLGRYEFGKLFKAMAIFALPTLANGAMGTLALYGASGQMPAVPRPEATKVAPANPPKIEQVKVPKEALDRSPKGGPKKTPWWIDLMLGAALATIVLFVMAIVTGAD